jgi:hypothetical protein
MLPSGNARGPELRPQRTRSSWSSMMSVRTTLLALLACTGCTGYGVSVAKSPPVAAFAPPPDGSATVCVFRPHGLGMSVITPVTDNGQLVGGTETQGYFCYLADPGQHQVRVDDAPPIAFRVEAGDSLYFRHEFHRGPDKLVPIDRAAASDLAKQCDYMVLDEAPEGRRAPALIARAPAQRTPGEPGVAPNRIARTPAAAKADEPN